MENSEAERKSFSRSEIWSRLAPNVVKATPCDPVPTMAAPVPWSLTWCDDGELAPQDRFDLLQSLVVSETEEVQPTLIAAIESLTARQMSLLCSEDVTLQRL